MSSYQDSESWFLIFHHNVKNGELFKGKNEALYYRGTDKFSLLSRINNKFKINGQYFEFKITYPEYDDCIHFTQKTNPMLVNEIEEGTVDVKKESNMNDHYHFSGLALGENDFTLLDTNGKEDIWFYSIGQFNFDINYNSSMPGPHWYCNITNNLIHEVNLYIKIIDLNLLTYLYSLHTYQLQNCIQIHNILLLIPFINSYY